MNMNKQVVASLLPFVAAYVKQVEATFIAPSAEKQRLCVGTIGNFYKGLKNQPVAWETIEPSVGAMIPALVEYYHSIGYFTHYNNPIVQTQLAQYVENFDAIHPFIPVYTVASPVETLLCELPDSIHEAIAEGMTVN